LGFSSAKALNCSVGAPHRQAVGIVDLRAPVVGHAFVVLAVLEHAGAGCQAQALDGLARVQGRIHVHHQRVARRDGEAVGARDAGRVQQRQHHHRVGAGRGALQVKGREVRELLRARQAGVDRQAARGQAVLPLAAHGAEVARAQEGRHVAQRVGVEVQAKAREAQVCRQRVRLEAALAVVEQRRVVSEFLRLAVGQLVEAHGALEEQPQVEELRLEAALLAGPQRVVGAKAQGLVLVPVQRGHRRRQLGRGRHVRAGSQGAGLALEGGVVERAGRAQGLEGGEGRGPVQEGQGRALAERAHETAS
jgi:hypothetical protein